MQESGEMYLESILIIGKKKNIVRAVDICEQMGFSKASVSRALSKLKKDGYVIIDENGFIAFTEKGRAVAEKIYERHEVLSEILMMLGVKEKTAVADACRMEHDISDETFNAIKEHIKSKKTL
ncbi:MAG: metal-dependent transcriptional regulator [Clostridia bacterium]|nr:metal-dependent transcriptional regulator [Clostridia bacterium]